MTDITWTHFGLPFILDSIPIGTESLIDLGCGRGVIGALCRIYRDPHQLVGVDSFEASVKFCERFNFYDKCLLHNLENMPLPFKEKEFEVATCIEVIEHLPKKSGEKLLFEIERIAKTVIVTSPTVFYKQSEYDANPCQKHLSLWTIRDFQRRGYKVFGAGEMKIFGRHVKYLSRGLAPLTRYIPSFSDNILCIKFG